MSVKVQNTNINVHKRKKKDFVVDVKSVMEDNDLLRNNVIGKGLYKMFLACDLSRCQTHHVSSAPAGTLTRIDGGVVHKGSKCKGKRVRCILFFSCSPD